ncbi:unnamed protein product, partial [Meganyctiphanes norvegica]
GNASYYSRGPPRYQKITWGSRSGRGSDAVYLDDSTATNISAVVGLTATLPCRVINRNTEDVSWVRSRDIHILTVGVFTYTSDDRFKVYHRMGSNDWNLVIKPLAFRDAGVYECQVATNPKISLPVTLNVEVQQAVISGPTEVYIQNGSTISLTCTVNTHSENVGHVKWYHNRAVLNYDSPRGGVSVEIEKTPERTTSKLLLTRAVGSDSGNYTCVPERADPAAVSVHVVTGEESAAVHTSGAIQLSQLASLRHVVNSCFLLLLWYHR